MKTARIYSKSSDLWVNKEGGTEKVSRPFVIGNFDQISSICQTLRVDRIVVALDEKRGVLPTEQLLFCRLRGIRVEEGVPFTEFLCGKFPVENLLPSTLIFSDGFKRSSIIRKMKRGMDIFFSSAGMLFFLPLTLAIALAIKWESDGPVFTGKSG